MLLVVLLACEKEPIVKTITAEDGALQLHLFNPTSCSTCDPFVDVDTIVLDVLQDDVVISTASFVWPDSELVLPELDGFGVVRVQMRGLGGGEVVSFGQTTELALGPGVTVDANLQFLAVNVALPLTSPMILPRTRHRSAALRNGHVLIAGGQSVQGDKVFAAIEDYDSATGIFADSGLALPEGLTDPAFADVANGERFFIGGIGNYAEGTPVPSAEIVRYVEESATLEATAPLNVARSGACVSAFRDDQMAVFGGHDEPVSRGELLRVSPDTGQWTVADIFFTDLDDRAVTGCTALADGRTFVQGSGVASTGIWSFSEASTGRVTPEAAFLPTPPEDPGAGAAFVVGAAIVPLASGDAWVGGGVAPSTGTLAGEARELRGATQRFDVADAQPTLPRTFGPIRKVDTEGTVAWGCGWRDLGHNTPMSSLELFNVETGVSGPVVPFTDDRSGCDLAVLADGAILVTGGAATPTGEIVVPYLR